MGSLSLSETNTRKTDIVSTGELIVYVSVAAAVAVAFFHSFFVGAFASVLCVRCLLVFFVLFDLFLPHNTCLCK